MWLHVQMQQKEKALHRLQPSTAGLMDKSTRQGSGVRRPLTVRPNWSLPEFGVWSLHQPLSEENIHMYGAAVTEVFHQKL